MADPQDLSRKWAVGIASAAAVEPSAVGSRLVALAGSRPAAACSLAAVLPSAEGELAGPLQRRQADELSSPRGYQNCGKKRGKKRCHLQHHPPEESGLFASPLQNRCHQSRRSGFACDPACAGKNNRVKTQFTICTSALQHPFNFLFCRYLGFSSFSSQIFLGFFSKS